MIFNKGQTRAINDAVNWFGNSSEQVFEIAGNPGTGKSVVINEILNRIQSKYKIKPNRIAPMAYTGAASIVMRLKGLYTARTIHSSLYEAVEVPLVGKDGKIVMDTYLNVPVTGLKFVPKQLKGKLDIIVIDEGGTVPLSMKNELLKTGAKILVAGDVDQLPPVADTPAFLTDYSRVHILDEIMRQAEGSAIIYLSQRAKLGLPIHTGWYSSDVLVIEEDQVTDSMLLSSPVILCGRNATRDKINNHIRFNIKGYKDPLPKYLEKVICRKNNWALEYDGINLTNGLTGTIVNSPDPSGFDGREFRIDFVPDMLPSAVFYNVPVSYSYISADRNQKDMMKKTGFVSGNLFEYGYSQTVHLAQGSQWTQGMYYEEYLNREINNRVHYTALTRFSNRCIYVKQRRKYY